MIEPLLNTGQASPCGETDVQGDVAFFNKLCINNLNMQGQDVQVPGLFTFSPAPTNSPLAVPGTSTWIDIPQGLWNGVGPAGQLIVWCRINLQNTGASNANVLLRLTDSTATQGICNSNTTIVAGGLASLGIGPVNITVPSNWNPGGIGGFKLQVQATQPVTVMAGGVGNLYAPVYMFLWWTPDVTRI